MTTQSRSTQTDLKRKAGAQKGQATRKSKAATASRRSTAGTARNRAEAERHRAAARGLTAARAVDVSIGGASALRERAVQTARKLRDPAALITDAGEDARRTVDRLERDGAQTRQRLTRNVQREARRAYRQVRERVPA